MLYTKLVKNNVISLGKLLRLMSENPAEKFGLKKRGKIEKGYHSDIVLIDLKKEFKIDKDRFFSKGKNTPFHGEIRDLIVSMIKKDRRISRKYMAETLGVSEKTITRYIKDIPNIQYVGKGKNGHWEVD